MTSQGLLSLQVIPGSNQQRLNYWGYSTTSFFAPMSRYSQAALDNKPASEIVDEFKTMVKECHKRGIEVILDVVFNHTAEGNEMGPTISFRSCHQHLRSASFPTCTQTVVRHGRLGLKPSNICDSPAISFVLLPSACGNPFIASC